MEKFRVPKDLFYSSDHIWVLVEDDIATVGISDFAQAELMEIVYTELPEVSAELLQGAPFGSVEAIKTVAELIAPVSGEVIEINETLESEPRLVNSDPYGDGWMVSIRMHDKEEVESLMTPQEYTMYTTGKEEA